MQVLMSGRGGGRYRIVCCDRFCEGVGAFAIKEFRYGYLHLGVNLTRNMGKRRVLREGAGNRYILEHSTATSVAEALHP